MIKGSDFRSKEYELFLEHSEEIGLDRTMVQAAGGNTSIKEGDTMWIKSSGKWLIDARSSELMVPVSISQIKDALKDNSCSYDEILI
jgi:rhamnose utilization protein RhaD (predicted bifunctional aldolase and dehydrogenase)